MYDQKAVKCAKIREKEVLNRVQNNFFFLLFAKFCANRFNISDQVG